MLVTAEPRAEDFISDLKPVPLPAVSEGCFYPKQPSQTDLKLHCKIQEHEIGNKIDASTSI